MRVMPNFAKTPLMSPPDAGGPAGFTTDWHGHGANHQGNNNPGDTAADRHNFGNAEAGKSGVNPTQGSAQDDFSEETGLPLVAVHGGHDDNLPDEVPDDVVDMLF